MTEKFELLQDIVTNRRTVKAAVMNGKKISDEVIMDLLHLANFAPTHGKTEPWRFNVYTGTALQNFCRDHADLYWNNTSEETRVQQTFNNLSAMGDLCSHLIVTTMRRTPETKIPFLEEYAATSAAVQNILLGAEAIGAAAIWSTGGMALKPAMKQYLQLAEEDEVVAFIYIGYTDQLKKEGSRNIPLSNKIKWT